MTRSDERYDCYRLGVHLGRTLSPETHTAQHIARTLERLRTLARALHRLDVIATSDRRLVPGELRRMARMEAGAAQLAEAIGCTTSRTHDPRAAGLVLHLPGGQAAPSNTFLGEGWIFA